MFTISKKCNFINTEVEKQEKEKISNELVAREKALADEQDSKAKLEDYLKELETKLVTGGDALA